jgi:Tfp pilus assembly protein PilO
MIKKFDTSFGGGASTSSTSSTSSKSLITLLVVVAVGFIGYKYVVKPMLERKDNENK